MTDNENKLKKVTERYQTLKMIADLSPIIATVLLVVVLAIVLAGLPRIIKIEEFEKTEEDYFKTVPARRAKLDTTYQHILLNQDVINSKLDLIILNQSRTCIINKNTLDSIISRIPKPKK